jgi:hypothetical protein
MSLLSNLLTAQAPPYVAHNREAVNTERMSARNLKDDAYISIEWTDYLTDHLELRVHTDWKRLYIFRFPCYLDMCLKALEDDKPDLSHTMAQALTRCYDIREINSFG